MIIDETGQLRGIIPKIEREEQIDLYNKKWLVIKTYIEVVSELKAEDIDNDYITDVLARDVRELMALVDKDISESRIRMFALVIQHTNKVPNYEELIELIEVI